ncbi:MAG: rhomboid family intramembrane serine protease [Planctomycetales bacterium]|nr:rhomboid family intramembrane serine protease [Planctomycetales bacterium]
MIPLRDNIPSRTIPIINFLMIAACAVVFLLQLRDEKSGQTHLVDQLAMIPERVSQPDKPVTIRDVRHVQQGGRHKLVEVERTLPPPMVPPRLTMLTCIFLHGGWMHFLGNMWFLWIFGDNVEDRFGHVGFALFYLGCGIAASAAHYLTDPTSTIPTIGASGAIAGVMGAYLVLYPRATVLSLVPILYIMRIVVIPAPAFLGIWFVIQLVQGTSGHGGGVAWWAHIGGFAVGAAVAALLGMIHLLRPPVAERLPNTERMTTYRYRRY